MLGYVIELLVVLTLVAVTIAAFRLTRPDKNAQPILIPWYELPGDSIAIRPYDSPDLATAEANLAAGFGWSVQSVTTSEGHVNVGRTVTGAVVTGGLSLLVGGSRTKGSVTVTYARSTGVLSASI